MNETTFTERNVIFAKNENNLIYRVESARFYNYDDCISLELYLKLVCGWDYINPDNNDIQGYVNAENFVENVQEEILHQYYLTESTKECLEANDFTICDCPITIHARNS